MAPASVALMAAAALVSGCATLMYEGVLQEGERVAIVTTRGTRVHRIDNMYAPPSAKELLIRGGVHAVVVQLSDAPPGAKAVRYSVVPIAACFDAEPGHRYVISPRYEAQVSSWLPVVDDVTTGRGVQAAFGNGQHPNCFAGLQRMKSGAASAASAASDEGEAAEKPPVSPVRLTSAGDGDEEGPASELAMKSRGDFHTELGLAFGGADIARVGFSNGEDATLSAGDGFVFSIGARWTPLWIQETVGLGVDADIGVKYYEVGASNGDISILRFPVIGAAHARFAVNESLDMLLRLGVQKDLGGEISGSGDISFPSISFDSNAGFLGEFGPYWTRTNHFNGAITFRVVLMDYVGSNGGGRVNANSYGVMFAGHYDFGPR